MKYKDLPGVTVRPIKRTEKKHFLFNFIGNETNWQAVKNNYYDSKFEIQSFANCNAKRILEEKKTGHKAQMISSKIRLIPGSRCY